MRLVMRILLFESALSWAMVLAGWTRVAVQVWPFAAKTLRAGFRGRAWKVGLSLLAGLPAVAGWPVLFSAVPAENLHGDWLQIAGAWWVMLGGVSSLLLVARISQARSRTERGTGCRCGTCVAYRL